MLKYNFNKWNVVFNLEKKAQIRRPKGHVAIQIPNTNNHHVGANGIFKVRQLQMSHTVALLRVGIPEGFLDGLWISIFRRDENLRHWPLSWIFTREYLSSLPGFLLCYVQARLLLSLILLMIYVMDLVIFVIFFYW